MSTSQHERALTARLHRLAGTFDYRWTLAADCELRKLLFGYLSNHSGNHIRLFFPKGEPIHQSEPWSLKQAQGATDGAEYLPSAKGTACGHIFKSGESTYGCKTCAIDETCVLCTKCFESSDHEGHQVFISISSGNSGCCDCGDKEAWKKDVICSIHSDTPGHTHDSKDKSKATDDMDTSGPSLPPDLVAAIRSTIAQAMDFLCDVLSCSPEQMRLAKTEDSIRFDEVQSRLTTPGDSSQAGSIRDNEHTEFALVLWNDEKHTVDDVKNQVARACKKTKSFGEEKAMEVNDIGRSIVQYSEDIKELLNMAAIIEQLKLTVTIRSSRECFREQMCASIIEWIADISGCSVGEEHTLLRNIICEELLTPWRMNGQGSNRHIGLRGIDDHEIEDNNRLRRRYRNMFALAPTNENVPLGTPGEFVAFDVEEASDDMNNAGDDNDEDYEDDDTEMNDEDMELDINELRSVVHAAATATMTTDAGGMDVDFMDDDTDVTEVMEAALAGYPAPPPPPQPAQATRRRILTPTESEDGELEQNGASLNAPFGAVPATPHIKSVHKRPVKPSKHWLDKPKAFRSPASKQPREDLWQRVRLDWLILYDLRLWKTLRIDLRHLYITTVVVIPQFKRLLGLRFAGLYTPLAELYLIADREPDHSIINLSIQMLTTPTITEEVVERGNFLTNLMAILYTFLTTRQVGYPEEVNPKAVLAFDAGTVTNRRMFHFFHDLRWLFQSQYIQRHMRTEPRYLLQFLDLAKLHQGICPNIRALGEHVEYESDAWISASLIIKDIDKLCRQVAMSFEPQPALNDGNVDLHRAIRVAAQVALINSVGYERKRFHQAELKEVLNFHTILPFVEGTNFYKVPQHVVQSEPMSFHHPLHYLLSWLIEHGRYMSRDDMRALLRFTPADLKDPYNNVRNAPAVPTNITSDQLLGAILDPPLRVCAWLAQTKAGMWVRNGITLRHQANSYRSVTNRDIGYQRDIVMVQAGLVLLGDGDLKIGEAFLAQMIDRIQMVQWMRGDYMVVTGFEEPQQLDVIEDFFHLLVIALCERGSLVPADNAANQAESILQHDIAHALCFKPLSYSDLTTRVTEKVVEAESFDTVLARMTNYKAPEGLSDTGLFELKPEYLETIDPYFAHYNRNMREEAENVYKKHMARKSGQRVEDVVYEPTLQPITHGLFQDLAAFTRNRLFTQIIFAALDYALNAQAVAPTMQVTRIETFLHLVLHLILIAVMEDREQSEESFISLAAVPAHKSHVGGRSSVDNTLLQLLEMSDYSSCHPTIKHIFKQMTAKQPDASSLTTIVQSLLRSADRTQTSSPASISAEDREKKKQEALARQARVMAQMKQQQNSFLMNQGIDSLEDDFEDAEDDMSITHDGENAALHRKTWSFPTGTCILCQEATNDQRLYGTFAYLGQSNILRTTPVHYEKYIVEALNSPASMDRQFEDRPFGVARSNRDSAASTGTFARQGLSEGFPQSTNSIKGPVSTSCGHIMHYSCFELYCTATTRRHNQQIARNHPERTEVKEFICPLCKALGNTFLPIIWKGKECASEQEIVGKAGFEHWLQTSMAPRTTTPAIIETQDDMSSQQERVIQNDATSQRATAYMHKTFMSSHVNSLQELSSAPKSPPTLTSTGGRARRGYSISSLFRMGRSGIMNPAGLATGFSDGPTPDRINELDKAYGRAAETVQSNMLIPGPIRDDEDLDCILALSRTLGMTVSSVEIANRGVESGAIPTGDVRLGSLLAELSEQSTTHLRILSESIDAYLAVGIQRQSGAGRLSRSLGHQQELLHSQLFDAIASTFGINLTPRAAPLLDNDIFLFFVDWVTIMNSDLNEALNVLQVCLLAEIVKVVLALDNTIREIDPKAFDTNPQDPALAILDIALIKHGELYSHGLAKTAKPAWLPARELIRGLCDRYALAFLRKCLLLIHVRYGVDFESSQQLDRDAPELARLTKLLQIASVDEILTAFKPDDSPLRRLVTHWCRQVVKQEAFTGQAFPITIAHPAILELVGLPKNYDSLTEEAIKQRCPTTGKELTDPACCLFCGEIFCSQAVCCMKDNVRGGCWQHMQKCGHGNVGIFINIRKCMVLFMHAKNGSFLQAPYLDRHGEPDPTLRRHHPLYLNQRRYDKLIRDVWLQHGIQNVISRKLEADINPGGWETL